MAENNFYFNEYENNIKSTWQELQGKKEYYDVTLACEDKQILVHKIIISSVRGAFKKIYFLKVKTMAELGGEGVRPG